MNENRFSCVLKLLIYLCAVIAGILVSLSLTNTRTEHIEAAEELSGFDFSSGIACVSEQCFDPYPNAFYTPDDFASGLVAKPSGMGDDGAAGYYTYRLTLPLEAGKVYGLSGYSATYAQRLWIDGVLCSAVGSPGNSLETTVPKTNYFTVYFEAKPGPTEIIIQRSGFVHADGGGLFPLYVGEQAPVSSMVEGMRTRSAVIIGGMLMASAFFFGIYLFIKERLQFLWFALACLLITIRTLSVDHKLIMVLFPDLNWELSLRLEYIATLGFFFFFFLYINRMFARSIKRAVNVYGVAIVCCYVPVVLLTPAAVYTRYLPYMQYGGLLYLLATVLLIARSMVRNRNNRQPEHFLILLGALAYAALILSDVLFPYQGPLQDLNLTQIGMMFFVLVNTLALAFSFRNMETQLRKARQNEREAEETNEMLKRLNRVKSDFLENISHEMRTPLTVMSSYAGVTLRQIKKNAVNEQTLENLDAIQQEALRLGRLVEQLKAVSMEKERQLTLTDTDAETLLQRAADFCEPICRKNENKIIIQTGPERIPVRVSADGVFQVLFNLILNANRHTHGGTIILSARLAEGAACVEVRDDGEGIDPSLIASVFERGVSGDGGTGLGLTICREIVEEHGGVIDLESHRGEGATARFTLPLR